MNIDRDTFLAALLALTVSSAAFGCSEDPPAAEAEPMETTGAEEPMSEPEPPPAAEPAAEPVSEPVPEVQPAGPTVE